MRTKESLEHGNFFLNRRREFQAKVDHAGVREFLANDEFAKISIVGNEDALFSYGDCQYFNVRQRARIVVGNRRDVMTTGL